MSIYGSQFDDENFELKHTGPGLLSMVIYFSSSCLSSWISLYTLEKSISKSIKANSGPGTNGCQVSQFIWIIERNALHQFIFFFFKFWGFLCELKQLAKKDFEKKGFSSFFLVYWLIWIFFAVFYNL